MNWLVVGAGDIAKKRIVPAILSEKRSRLAGVCDVVETRARELAQGAGAKVFTDYAAALRSGGADAVYVCTPVSLHVSQAVSAVQAGKHVLVEKPLGVTASDAERLVAVARASDRKCGVAYFRRLTPRHLHVKDLLRQGTLGQIVLVRMCYSSWFNPEAGDPKFWRVMPEKSGGGPLSDMGAHMFDLLIDAFGLPVSVCARAETLTHAYAVEDSATLTMKLAGGPADPAQGRHEGTQTGGGLVTGSFNWNSKTWSHEYEVVGTEGRVTWRPYDSGPVVLTVGRLPPKLLDLPSAENVHLPLIEDFVSAVIENRAPVAPPEQALLTNRLLDAVYRSSRECREVRP